MEEELKTRGTLTVGSKAFFKWVNARGGMAQFIKDSTSFQYYAQLGNSSTKVKAALSGQPGAIVTKALQNTYKMIGDALNSSTANDVYITYQNRQNLKTALSQLGKCGIKNTSSLNAYIDTFQRLEDFHNQVITIPTLYQNANGINAKLKWNKKMNELYITAYVHFQGVDFTPQTPEQIAQTGVDFPGSSRPIMVLPSIGKPMELQELTERKKRAVTGFKKWEGRYSVFGGQPIQVYVDVIESSDSNTIKVNFIKEAFDGAFSLGGKKVFDWTPEGNKTMFLGYDDVDIYKHEFGHSLGVGDAYKHKWVPIAYDLQGVDPDLYPEDLGTYPKNADGSVNMVMNNNGPVTNNDIEMVILAFSTGQRQNYQPESTKNWVQERLGEPKISEALGRGN